jgi:hypothetical protein
LPLLAWQQKTRAAGIFFDPQRPVKHGALILFLVWLL